jgi:branched-chain amino acid transport system substrate-binding protein
MEVHTMHARTSRFSLTLPKAALATALAVALAVAIAGCGGGSTSATTTTEPVKIGAVLSLTGTYAGLGQPEKNVLDLYVASINKAGGINGRPIQMIVEDDATDETKAAAAASKLIEQDKVVAIIGATGTGQTMAMRGAIDRAKIPEVSLAGGTAVTNPIDPLVFATPWSNTIVVPFLFNYMKSQGITKVGLISDSGGFGKDGKAVIAAVAPKVGVKVVADETFNPGDTDMTAQLIKIKNSGAQAIVMWTAGAEAAIIVKNVKDLGIKLPVYASHGIARREFIDGAGAAANGVKFAAGKILIPKAWGEGTPAFKVATDFVNQYTAAYQTAPNTFAGHAYDALNIIVDAAKRVQGDLTPAALRDQIEQTSGFVGIGGTFNMSATDHNGMTASDLVTYKVTGGTWVVLK